MHIQNYPEDSVLRRHYEQLKNAENDASTQRGASPREAESSTTSSVTTAGSGKTGFFGWLQRLFGG